MRFIEALTSSKAGRFKALYLLLFGFLNCLSILLLMPTGIIIFTDFERDDESLTILLERKLGSNLSLISP